MMMVFSIIAVLAGLILMAFRRLDPFREKTGVIIATVSQALITTAAQTGALVAPAEHPFAGSRATRLGFVRAADGSAVASDGLGLRGVDLASLDPAAIGRDHLLEDSDRFADPRVPFLFGGRRGVMGVLGARLKAVTGYLRLPKPGPDAQVVMIAGRSVPVVTSPVDRSTISLDPAHFPDALEPSPDNDADPAYGLPGASQVGIAFALGAGGAYAQLTALDALHSAPEDGAYTHLLSGATAPDGFTAPALPHNDADGRPDGAPLARVYSDAAGDGSAAVSTTWKPGCIRHGGTGAAPLYRRYRLPGLAVYDAWGRELLYSTTASGGLHLLSAGADGVLVFDPGADHVLDTTDPRAAAPAGDDLDGTKDNISGDAMN
jgi:hypothetical protein